MGFIATPSTGNGCVWADLGASARLAKIGWLADLGYMCVYWLRFNLWSCLLYVLPDFPCFVGSFTTF